MASVVVAPRLAADEPVARLVGSVVGAAAFTCLALLRLPAWASVAGSVSRADGRAAGVDRRPGESGGGRAV